MTKVIMRHYNYQHGSIIFFVLSIISLEEYFGTFILFFNCKTNIMEFLPDRFKTDKKVVFVTGATGAIGRAIAWNIGRHPDYAVIMLVRNPDKAVKVLDEIRNRSGNEEVYFYIIDLSCKKDIDKLAETYHGPLHVLVNNASTTPRSKQTNNEGIELQWATNVLGYFYMMKAFTPHLKSGTSARIVNVASYWAGGLDLDDPEFMHRQYNNDTAYRQSKQAERMLSTAFASVLSTHNISVNACHPGDVNSNLSNDLGFGGHESPDRGAATPVWLAVDPATGQQTGKYFEHQRESPCQFSTDKALVDRLVTVCESY